MDEIETMSDEDLETRVRTTWDSHFGVVSRVNWDLFAGGADQILGLLGCLTRRQVRGVCERLVKRHRHTRSGFPDLTLWDPAKKECLVVEVKGPNDRLSDKQVLWIDYLNRLGIKAFCCHVEAVGGKKLGRKSSAGQQHIPDEVKGLKRSNSSNGDVISFPSDDEEKSNRSSKSNKRNRSNSRNRSASRNTATGDDLNSSDDFM